MQLTDDTKNSASLINHSRGIKSLEKGVFFSFFFLNFIFGIVIWINSSHLMLC